MGRRIRKIVLHCSASAYGNALLIDQWHKAQGWQGIGYHYVILNGYPDQRQAERKSRWTFLDGSVECGRPLDKSPCLSPDEVGAHVYGFNRDSIGICLIGQPGDFSIRQLYAARTVVSALRWEFGIPLSGVIGHYELDSQKTCPGINLDHFRQYLMDDRKLELLVGELIRGYS
jgi:hypothetical protein